MELKQRRRHDLHPTVQPHGEPGGEPGTAPQGQAERSVFCRSSIHSGHFPIQGRTVGDARRTLAQLLNIDPDAVPVINGQVVDESQLIDESVVAIDFVKRSSVKG